jgi:quinol monooxygenase YgiN
MSDTILVTGVLDFDPAKRDAAIAAVTEAMTATLAEDGCEHYSFAADLADPGRFHLSERWASQAAMDAHMATPHLGALLAKMADFGVTGVNITKWTGATGEKLM